jgi:hypothetical protein
MTGLLFAAAIAFVCAAPASAREWRGCAATFVVASPAGSRVIWRFDGRGSCRSRAYANDCRRAAKGAIDACARDAWSVRWERRIPGTCRPQSGSNRPFVQGLYNTAFGRGYGALGDQDFKWEVERAACCHLYPNANTATVGVGWNVSGDKGCVARLQEATYLEYAYVAECRRFRERGYCGGAPQRDN